jgi:hypothetical protein
MGEGKGALAAGRRTFCVILAGSLMLGGGGGGGGKRSLPSDPRFPPFPDRPLPRIVFNFNIDCKSCPAAAIDGVPVICWGPVKARTGGGAGKASCPGGGDCGGGSGVDGGGCGGGGGSGGCGTGGGGGA